MTHDEIKAVVRETVDELKKTGLLRDNDEIAYTEIGGLLTAYYRDGEQDDNIMRVLRGLEKDQYYKIIPLYFSCGYTNEKIAEIFGVEVSTVTRNKKRLCLEIYKAI